MALSIVRQQFETIAYSALETDREFNNQVSAARLIAINGLALAAAIEPNGQPLSDLERIELSNIAASIATVALEIANGETINSEHVELVGFHLLRTLH